jgi:hypothetical protein
MVIIAGLLPIASQAYVPWASAFSPNLRIRSKALRVIGIFTPDN